MSVLQLFVAAVQVAIHASVSVARARHPLLSEAVLPVPVIGKADNPFSDIVHAIDYAFGAELQFRHVFVGREAHRQIGTEPMLRDFRSQSQRHHPGC